MRGVEDRLTFVERQVGEHQIMLENLDQGLAGLRQDMNRRFDAVDVRFNLMDARLDRMDGRFDRMETRFETRFDRMDDRFNRLDAKMSRQFVWLAGMLVTTLVAMLLAVSGNA